MVYKQITVRYGETGSNYHTYNDATYNLDSGGNLYLVKDGKTVAIFNKKYWKRIELID